MKRNWGIGIAIAGGAYLVNSFMAADRDSTGAIVSAGNVDAFQMRVGDCFNDGSTFGDDSVDSVPGVPCADPHDNEVYAVFDVTAESAFSFADWGLVAFNQRTDVSIAGEAWYKVQASRSGLLTVEGAFDAARGDVAVTARSGPSAGRALIATLPPPAARARRGGRP